MYATTQIVALTCSSLIDKPYSDRLLAARNNALHQGEVGKIAIEGVNGAISTTEELGVVIGTVGMNRRGPEPPTSRILPILFVGRY